jgi:phosphopantothenoylcysteine decarboxylase / phosphopantothenate---cysteine ligase
VLVGFALETDDDERVVARAREKLLKKGVDLVVANHAAESLGRDDIRVHLVEKDATHALEAASKRDAADSILDWLVERFSEQPA